MRVTPAILANDLPQFTSLIRSAETFTDYVQVDMMDGIFVPSTSIGASELGTVKTSLRSEAHLMVANPEDWLEALAVFGSEAVLFHYEAVADPPGMIWRLREAGFGVRLAVNPETSVADILSFIDSVDSVMFMTVHPGFYGASFLPEVLEKIQELKKVMPDLMVGVDGGIKEDNAILAKDAGADFVCIGSAIFLADDPGQAYNRLKKTLNSSA
ncbi:MAG: ribulose-phosphate 3-epimerase [Actinomycetota bacterium]